MQLERDIKNDQLQPIYIVFGQDDYLMQQVKLMAMQQIVPQEEWTLNVSQYNMLETSLDEAIAEAESYPFFGERKVVILDNAYFLTGEKVKGIDQNSDLLATYALSPNLTSIVLILVPTKLDNRKKIVKQLLQQYPSIDVSPLDEAGIRRYVNQEASKLNVTIQNEALQLLMQRKNADLALIMNELHKLKLTTNAIDVSIVEQLVAPSLENNVFALSEWIEKKQLEKALNSLHELLLQKEEPVKLLAILLSQYRLNLQVALLLLEGYQQSDIAKYLKIHPYRIQQAVKQTKCYRLETLKSIYQILVDTDYQLKSSATDNVLLLELAIIKIVKGFSE